MKIKIICALPLLLLLFKNCSSNESPEVKTKHGTYIGTVIKSRGGKDISAYKGIPFAKPPVGNLRFKEPVAVEPSEGIYNATKETACFQPRFALSKEDSDKVPKILGSEDCLHLSVYVPKSSSAQGPLPVYFWIHGGGFYAGSNSEEWDGPKWLLDGNRDVIMVATNYRLGMFGFLSANDDTLPGNLGLKDQALALKWVKENIEAFGGDPNSVTIGGVSAGAASVAYHMNSKATRGLFSKAISQSGTAANIWSIKSKKEARAIAATVLSNLSCPIETKELVECLQKIPAEVIMKSVDILKNPDAADIMHFSPVLEQDSPNAFMTEQSFKEGSTVPWINGITNEEGLIFFHMLALHQPAYLDLSILKDKFNEILPIVNYYSSSSQANNITEDLRKYYFGDKAFSKETAKIFVQILSDVMFNHGLHTAAKNYKGKLYMYMLSYRGNNSIATIRPEGLENSVSHGDDILYFFKAGFKPDDTLNDSDWKFSNTILDMWYNFIKSGDPTPDTHLWEESDGGHKYLDFTNEGYAMKSDFFNERMEFLDKIDILSRKQIE